MEDAKRKQAEEAAEQEMEKLYGVDANGYLRPLLKAMQSKDSEAVKVFVEKVENLNTFDAFYKQCPYLNAHLLVEQYTPL